MAYGKSTTDIPGVERTLTSDLGRVLSRPSKSRPFWPPRSPRWILQCFDACDANVPVEGGVFQLNRVTDGPAGLPSLTSDLVLHLPSVGLRATHSHPEGGLVDTSLAMYAPEPKEIPLEVVQSIVRTQTRVAALFSETHDQLQWQLTIAGEFLYETKENLVFNHPDHGLLHNVDPSMEFTHDGPPSPDVLDSLLARAWKRPDCFMMHPEALAEFHRQANARSLTLEPLEMFGVAFTSWRGLPICPTNKLQVIADGSSGARAAEGGEWLPRLEKPPHAPERPRPATGGATTDVLLARLGYENQGVVSLHAAGAGNAPALPYVTVESMGIADDAAAQYLLTTYTAVAVLSPGALARARVRL